jgi:hypothetical protein
MDSDGCFLNPLLSKSGTEDAANPPPPGYCDVATLKKETSEQIGARLRLYKSSVRSCDVDIDFLTAATWMYHDKVIKERGWIRTLFMERIYAPVPIYTGPD